MDNNNLQQIIEPIAHIKTAFNTKFGIPKQSGLVKEVIGTIIFTPKFQNEDALRGITDFSHLWLIWGFSEAKQKEWSPTVRPPRLGGNTRMGVFATRSPFRPNSLGLSTVELIKVEKTENHGTVIHVSGADLMDGTPIYDIKPYIVYADSHPEATGGFTEQFSARTVEVDLPQNLTEKIPTEHLKALIAVLKQDPRPSYQDDPKRVYGFKFSDLEIKFNVKNGILTVLEIE